MIANSPAGPAYFRLLHAYIGPLSVLHWINDALMAVFFLLVGLEIKREFVDGNLSTWADRRLPIIAAAAGMLVPALAFLLVVGPASPLARAEWLAIGDAQGRAQGARITAAWPLSGEEVETGLAHRIEQRSVLNWNESAGRVEARLERRLGAIILASGPDSAPDPAALAALLLEKARERLGELLPAELIARARYAALDALDPARLADEADEWLAPLLAGRRALDLPKGQIVDALLGRLDWDQRQRLDRLAPREWASPAGTHHAIDYAAEGGPSVEVRVQALFGLDRHPTVGQGGEPLLLQLTSPAGRPIQATRDLPAFWRGSWRDVVKDMKGRYPKHRWPDEPWAEAPSLKTKNAFNRT